ncbi:hypothetical protein [Rhizobium sp. MHM7A]|uniref:hypothetical protein n=1 Tax=Rhizobium sp. MHM7A TaxID=2583233 RepID=UPI0011058C2B|nr:hypothetical protein [Rhizobium sp. MHM7A]TLX16975.1 hypothetical protein FFR93_06555 [Rhizobium sp. MHM7A]
MIDQNSLQGNPVWLPSFKSFVSECAFFAFSSGNSTIWSGGRMVFNNPEAIPDPEHFREIRRIYGDTALPSWAEQIIAAVDATLPSPEIILAALDDHSMVVSSSPAPFRIPQTPSSDELAKCLFAARALAAVRSELVFPLEMEEDEVVDELHQAAHLCAMIGGDRTVVTAMVWADDERNYGL